MNHEKSRAALVQARQVLVGGVNSPARAYNAVGGEPPFIASAAGPLLTDIDDNTYIDYVGSWGPAILGHAYQPVLDAVSRAAQFGLSFGAPCEAETRLAALIADRVESIEKVRFTSSGTEAAMTAVRLARGATGRSKIVKFAGCYHGHADALLVAAGSGATTLGVPSSPGVPAGAVGDTLLAEFNDAAGVEAIFEELGEEIAAVLVEPIAGNMGLIPPVEGFLEALRRLCERHGSLLVFDEVMTGFRVAPGGAQQLLGVRPDLTVLGKAIGGGMPVGAVGGAAELMDQLSPAGPVYQAGTLSGNPVAMAAGLATIQATGETGFYDRLEAAGARLGDGLVAAAREAGLGEKTCVQRVGSMLTVFFGPGPIRSYADATACDTEAFGRFFTAMLEGGVYLPPSQFESWFISAAHQDAQIDATMEAAGAAFKAV
jgi:glutamate-1-semialdehyde 2,1-aminomutase